jgi:hypothetical protein
MNIKPLTVPDLTACIPADHWDYVDADRAALLIGCGAPNATRRLRALLGLPVPPDPQHTPEGGVIVGEAGDGHVIGRLHFRQREASAHWLWRRFPAGTPVGDVMLSAAMETPLAHLLEGAQPRHPASRGHLHRAHRRAVALHPQALAVLAEPPPEPRPAPAPAPTCAPKPRRETLTTMGPDEFDALLSHVLSEADRRGLIYAPAPPKGLPAPALADLTDPELRRQHADLSAELERRREALRARLAALG